MGISLTNEQRRAFCAFAKSARSLPAARRYRMKPAKLSRDAEVYLQSLNNVLTDPDSIRHSRRVQVCSAIFKLSRRTSTLHSP